MTNAVEMYVEMLASRTGAVLDAEAEGLRARLDLAGVVVTADEVALVLVTPAGVFVVAAQDVPNRDELRARVHRVRADLDATGLVAMPAHAVLAVTHEPLRRERDLLVGDLVAHALTDRRFGRRIIDRACAALGHAGDIAPPPFVATVAEPAHVHVQRAEPRVRAR